MLLKTIIFIFVFALVILAFIPFLTKLAQRIVYNGGRCQCGGRWTVTYNKKLDGDGFVSCKCDKCRDEIVIEKEVFKRIERKETEI